MLKNYIKIAWRGLISRKGYSVINITGLAVGIAACLLLFIVVRYELSYDTFQKNYARIYHVVTQNKYPDGMTYNPGVPVPALAALRVEYPDVQFGAVHSIYGSQVKVATPGNPAGNKFIEKTGIFFCEPQFLDVFEQQWLAGDKTALANPNFVVLNKKTAEKYFGSWQNATGKLITLDNNIPLTVAGIVKDAPANTDFPLNVLVSFKTVKQNTAFYGYYDNWNALGSNFQVYALAPNNVTVAALNNRLLSFSKSHYKNLGTSVETNFLQPLSDVHFDARFDNLGDHKSSKPTLFTLSLIAVFIVLMACINFVNLSTAQAVNRSKEIGVRKAMGGSKPQLFWQIMGETAVIVFAAVVLATIIAVITLPYLTNIASIPQQLSLFTGHTMFLLLAIGFLVTVVAGIYPSWVMSRFNPILALKSKFSNVKAGGMALRRSLVVVQFAISQVLVAGTIVAITQMNFVHNADLGFNKDAVLVLNSNNDSTNLTKIKSFKLQLQALPGVQSVSNSMDVPSSDNNSATNFAFNHKTDETYEVFVKFADEDYLKTFGLKLAAGRNYTASDTVNEVLINETLAKRLSPNNPASTVGKTIRLGGGRWNSIVGVVSDFKQNSLREAVKPMFISSNKQFYQQIAIKVRTNNLAALQSSVEKLWNQYFPQYAYSAQFLDASIAEFYKQDEQLSLLYKIFAGLAIFISCLGLYGLVSFMAVQRTKEMGIRKVLGASIGHIVYLFSKEFTVLILLSFVIAVPVAYVMMNSWLQNFVYRINMAIWMFAVAIVISILIAWVTVGYKAIRAALANPVESLRAD